MLCSVATLIHDSYLPIYAQDVLGLSNTSIGAVQGIAQFLCQLTKGISGVAGDMLGSQVGGGGALCYNCSHVPSSCIRISDTLHLFADAPLYCLLYCPYPVYCLMTSGPSAGLWDVPHM